MENLFATHDALAVAELIKTRKLGARELLDATLARLRAVNGKLNAITDFYEGDLLERSVAAAGEDLADLGAGAFHQARGFLGAIGRRPPAYLEADEDGAFPLGNRGIRIPANVRRGPTPAWPAPPWKWRACTPSA